MRILVLLCIQKASKERPPDRRFYSCCASRRRPKRGRRIADSIRVVHPEGIKFCEIGGKSRRIGTLREAARSQILLLLCIQKASNEMPPDRGF